MGDEFDPASLRAIRERLAVVDELQARRVAALQSPLGPRSAAARDLELPDGRFVRIYAAHASFNAIDHLLGWRILAHSPLMPVVAPASLLRGAIENADRCRWHIEPKLRPGKRVGRALSARRDDQARRKTFDEANGPGPRIPLPSKGRTAAQRLAELDTDDVRAARAAAGVDESAGYGDATSVASAYGHHRWYMLGSGAVHAKEWALAYITRFDRSTWVSDGAGTRGARFSIDERFIANLTNVAVQATEGAVRALEVYFSGPTDTRGRTTRRTT